MADITIKQVREKYPQYSDMSDEQLADALHTKYYSDMDKGQFYQKIGLSQKEETYITEPTRSEEPTFMGKVGEAAVKRAGNVDSWRAPVVVGQAAGFVNDTAAAALESLYGMLPEGAREKVKSIVTEAMNTEAGKAVSGLAQKGAEKYGEFKGKNPELAKDLEGIANMAGVIPVTKVAGIGASAVGQGAKAVGKEGAAIAGDVGRMLVPPVQGALDQELKGIVKLGINKGIRPTVAGKSSAPKVAAYYDKATDAVKSIVENKANLQIVDATGNVAAKLPESLHEFSQAIDQTKKTIFQKYDGMKAAAGQSGASVNLSTIVSELDNIATNKVVLAEAPDVAKYAHSKARAYESAQAYTADEAQQAIAMANERLEAFYKNPTYENATKARIDAMVANNMRKGLDDAIEQSVGPGYQELKNQYGSLKAIEKEVNQRAIVDSRKNAMGLIDYSNVFTGFEVINGILTLKPHLIAAGAGARAIADFVKWKINPNRYVSQMFQGAEKNLTKQTLLKQGNPAQSATMQALGF